MPRQCAVAGCDTHRRFYEAGLRFFAFPTGEAARETWRTLIGREADWTIPRVPSVCQKHFLPSEIPEGRRLAETVLPSVNLPVPQTREQVEYLLEIEPISREEVLVSKGQDKERKSHSRRKRKSSEIDSEPDPEESAINCRLCATELSPDEGLNLEELKDQQRVNENIWNVCQLDFENSDFERNYSLICDKCWENLTNFEEFAAKCSRKQTKLFKAFLCKESTDQSPEEFKQEVHAESLEVEESSDSKEKSADDLSDDEDDHMEREDLPSLEGLSIPEMIEALDKVVPKNKVREDYTIDQECWDCGQVFTRLHAKKQHRKTCALIGKPESLRNKTYICEICKKHIRTRAGYRLHLVKMHRETEEMPPGQLEHPEELRKVLARKHLKCPLCSKQYQQVYQLKYHLKSHLNRQLTGQSDVERQVHRSSTCQECGKTFSSAPYLRQHMKFHLKIKDHGCDRCEKKFYTKSDLKVHQRSVHLKQTFLCGICGKRYGTKVIHDRHVRNVHNREVSVGKLACPFCEKRFRTPMELRYHEMVHTGERNHRCELCDHAFRHRYALTQHKIKAHGIQVEGVKLYKQYRRKYRRGEEQVVVNISKGGEGAEDEEYDQVEYLL